MTTEIVRSYTPEQKRQAVCAAKRYGYLTTTKILESLWGYAPVRNTLYVWENDGRFQPTETEMEFWREIEDNRKKALQAGINERMNPLLELVDHFIEQKEAGKLQQAAISLGIFYDKLVPGPRSGGGSVSIDHADNVQLMVVAPSSGGERRQIGSEVLDA